MTDGDRQDIEDLKAISTGATSTRNRAMTALYRRHVGWLRRFFSASRVDWSTSDDLIQEVFTKIDRNAASYRGDAPASAWMRVIAKRVLLSHLERLKTDPLSKPAPESHSDTANTEEGDPFTEIHQEPAGAAPGIGPRFRQPPGRLDRS